MSTVLNSGLHRSSLLEVADLVRGVSYRGEEARREAAAGLVPVLRANNIQNGHLVFDDLVYVPAHRVSEVQQLRKQDIVIAMSSGSRDVVGKAGLFEGDWFGSFGAFCGVLRVKGATNSRLLYHFLQSPSYRRQVERVATGTNINNLSRATLGSIEVSLPEAQAQEVMARLLSDFEDKRSSSSHHLSAARRSIERFRLAVLAAACTGRLTTDWREEGSLVPAERVIENLRHRHETLLARERRTYVVEASMLDLDAASLPVSWSAAPLRLLCEPGRPITYGILKPGPMVEDGVPYVRVMDFNSGEVNLTSIKKTSRAIAEAYQRSALRAGDLLFAIRGSYGHVAVVPTALEGANITQDTARLSIDSAVVTQYVLYALQAPDTQARIQAAAKGVAVQGVNLGDLRELLLPLPPREEQEQIVERVDRLLAFADRLLARVDRAGRRVTLTTQAVLAKAFRGDLVLLEGQHPQLQPEGSEA